MTTIQSPIAEAAALATFDRRIGESCCFSSYPEVDGEILQPRLGTEKRSVRIDRILVPTAKLLAAGWTSGPIGIEAKRPGFSIGKPVSQLLDYLRSVFCVGGYQLVLEWGFLYPYEPVHGALGVVMAEHRIGVVGVLSGERIVFDVGGKNVIAIDGENNVAVSAACRGGKAGRR